MNKLVVLTIALGAALLAGGCAHNNVVADSTTRNGDFYGDLGITGDMNLVTVEKHSRLTKLSIIGHGNEVIIEEGARLPAIEVFGSDNTISIPDYMIVQMNQVGNRNQLIRRPPSEMDVTTRTYRIRQRGDEVDISVESDTSTATIESDPVMIVDETDEPLEPVEPVEPAAPLKGQSASEEAPPLKGESASDAPAGEDPAANPIK